MVDTCLCDDLSNVGTIGSCLFHRFNYIPAYYLLAPAAVKVKVNEGESDALASSTLQPVEAEQVVGVDTGVGRRHEQSTRSPVAVHRLAADRRRCWCSDVVRCCRTVATIDKRILKISRLSDWRPFAHLKIMKNVINFMDRKNGGHS